MQPVLQAQNIEKYYGAKGNVQKVLKGVSFDVNKGEFIGVMGASGSGKTTLLNCISTIDTPSSGNIFIGGRDISKFNRSELADFRGASLGFVFQDFNLLNTLNGFDNIAIALSIKGVNPREIEIRVKTAAQKLGITNILYKFPYQMSGGEKQRIACARAIVTEPQLILADEPTGALDSASAKSLLGAFETLNKEHGATILMVTHDPFTASYCSRILFIKDGKLFSELVRGADNRKEFFDKIIDVVTFLGGEGANVL